MLRRSCRSLVVFSRLGGLRSTAALLAPSYGSRSSSAALRGRRAAAPRGDGSEATAVALGVSGRRPPPPERRPATAAEGAAPLLPLGDRPPRGLNPLIVPPAAPKPVDPEWEEAEEGPAGESDFSVDAAADAYGGQKEEEAEEEEEGEEAAGGGRAGGGLSSVIDDPELAALVAAHKARHGSVTPPTETATRTSSAGTKTAATQHASRKAAPKKAARWEAVNYGAADSIADEREDGVEATAAVSSVEDVERAGRAAPRAEPATAALRRAAEIGKARSRVSQTRSLEERSAASALSILAATPGLVSAADTSVMASPSSGGGVPTLTNPFAGIHECLTRSYRLDQLVDTATVNDVILARQERKSGAFSFLQFKAGKGLYEGHWASLAELQATHQRLVFPGGFTDGTVADMIARLRTGRMPIPGFSLFNNDLGLFDPRVASSASLLLAQRLLLFPDAMRHFHTLCGRENVPCDFYADVDLPDATPEEGEQTLLEILNYLEVRLPGIGLTDPFFLVLTNAVPGKDKASYHIHARSMTYRQEEAGMAMGKGKGGGSAPHRAKAKKKAKKGEASGVAVGVDDGDTLQEAEEGDDLTDLVNAVEGRSGGGGGGAAGAAGQGEKTIATPRVIAFQDYRTVKLLGDEVNQTIGKSVIDDNCYRLHGMLRCAFSAKLPSSQDHRATAAAALAGRRLVPMVTATDSALQKKLKHMEAVLRTMTDPEILELTFCNRYLDDAETTKLVQHHLHETLPARPRTPEEKREKDQALRAAHRHRFKLLRPRHILGPQSAQAVEYDTYGNVVSPYLTEAVKWKRYNHVVQKLRTLPPRAAEGFDVWVRVGLALHNFSNEDHVFDEWVRFSLKCPQKYSRDVCRKKWTQFERNPDALNWRRGFNYLNSTVWRQI